MLTLNKSYARAEFENWNKQFIDKSVLRLRNFWMSKIISFPDDGPKKSITEGAVKKVDELS